MTTTLDALKAAREALGRSLLRLRGPGDRDYAEACDYALTLLDAAIQRISDCETCDGTGVCYSEWPVRDSDGGMCDIDGEEHPCPDCCAAIKREEAQPPSGVVSREAAEAACREAARMVGRFVSVPSEPMVPRSLAEAVFWSGFRAGESCAEASHRGECGCDTTAAEEAARILDGEASDGQ